MKIQRICHTGLLVLSLSCMLVSGVVYCATTCDEQQYDGFYTGCNNKYPAEAFPESDKESCYSGCDFLFPACSSESTD